MATRARGGTRSSTKTKNIGEPTTSRVTRATSAQVKEPKSTLPPLPKTGTTRKPFVSRDNSPELKTAAEKPPKLKSLVSAGVTTALEDGEKEPIRAYLRIRPQLNEDEPLSTPYLEPISDFAVRMVDPSGVPSRSRLSTINPSSVYTFSHIFPPDTAQPNFFNKTTLPLVQDVLEGRNALLFAYGVTNSGKTYTIQGGHQGSAGILPRSLDVIFNSIEGLHGDGRYRPVRLQGIDLTSEITSPSTFNSQRARVAAPALADVLLDISYAQSDTDSTKVKLDRNYEYTIWLSYAEVYNEKVYDLLGSVDESSASSTAPSGIPRATSSYLNLPAPTQSSPLLLTRKALSVKPCPLADSDSPDSGSAGRYIAGLRQLRVRSAAQAKEFLRLGQLHRTVFGTLANSQSSRSHAFVTVKVLRVHKGDKNDPSSVQISRLTLVDLAGSERTKHTQTTGDRLREAGNINNSLMVLGQCMETMRSNQRILARSLAGGVGPGTRLDTKDVRKGLAVVPFRHSKLTEILMDYFVGDGKVVMIVNVNPYDTGYDENSHVMKFAALAREVCTTTNTAIPRPLPSIKNRLDASVPSRTRKVTLSLGGAGRKVSETHLEVLEEDEEQGDGSDSDDGPINPLVNALFDEIEMLRMQLFEAEMKAAIIEAETREEVMQEMEARMRKVEKMYTQRLMAEVQQNEVKMDEKLDMLQNSKLFGKQSRRQLSESDDELEDIEEEEVDESFEERSSDEEDQDANDRRPSSPLAGKAKVKKTSSIKPISAVSILSESEGDASTEDKTEGDESETDDWRDCEERRSSSRSTRSVTKTRTAGRSSNSVEALTGGLTELTLSDKDATKKIRQPRKKSSVAQTQEGGGMQLRRSTRGSRLTAG